MTQATNTVNANRAPRRSWTRRFVWLLVVLVALWSAAWYGLSFAAGIMLDRWIAREAAAGREWSCAERSVAGYPFRMRVRCDGVSLLASQAGARRTLKLPSLAIGASVFEPGVFVAEPIGPLEAGDGRTSVRVSWQDARLATGRGEDGRWRVSLALATPLVSVRDGQAEPFELAAERGDLRLVQMTDLLQSPGNFEVSLAATGIVSRRLADLTGETGPGKLDLVAALDNVPLRRAPHAVEALEGWRRANGVLRVTKASVALGQVLVEGRGDLALDSEHRLAGGLELGATGIAPVFRKLGIPQSAIAVGGLLTGWLAPKAQAGQTGEKPISLPLRLRDGKVLIGAFPAPFRLTPLY